MNNQSNTAPKTAPDTGAVRYRAIVVKTPQGIIRVLQPIGRPRVESSPR